LARQGHSVYHQQLLAWYFYVWMMVILKIPIIALLYLVWWASKSPDPVDPEPARIPDDERHPHRPRNPRRPRPPRRGPHADPLPVPPPRVRIAKGRRIPSHGR
jgi:hypothetical protein